MGSLLERLEQREAAARGQVEALRAEMTALAERLADQEALLERLEITKQTVVELLAGEDVDQKEAAARAGTPAAVAAQVPFFTPDGNAAGQGLPVSYRDVVEVLASCGVGLRASQVCRALGTGGEPRHREGMRSKLKRLAGRGWLVEGEPGLFTLADGVAEGLEGAEAGGQERS
jgi:hypothetical protein